MGDGMLHQAKLWPRDLPQKKLGVFVKEHPSQSHMPADAWQRSLRRFESLEEGLADLREQMFTLLMEILELKKAIVPQSKPRTRRKSRRKR